MIQALADPRGGDRLLKVHRDEAAHPLGDRSGDALAEIGDVRAVPTLAKRLRMDPLKIYSDQNDYEMMLKRDDNERVVAARMIADLAVLHPAEASTGSASRPKTRHLLAPRAALAARQRSARAGRDGVDEGHRRLAQVGQPQHAAAQGGPAAADAGGVGDRAERDALRRLAEGRSESGACSRRR